MRLQELFAIVCTLIFCGTPATSLAGSRATRHAKKATRHSKKNRKAPKATTRTSQVDPEEEALKFDYTGDSNAPATHATVLEALQNAGLPSSTSRKSVIPKGALQVQQACLGLVGSRQPRQSMATLSAPHLTKLLTRYLEGPDGPGAEVLENFVYTSIQLNANYAAKEHVDFNNLGPSLLIALGNFTGGRLNYAGESHCVRESWLSFDGREPHSVENFLGKERYSIVFFCNGSYAKAAPAELDTLGTQFGFRVPTSRLLGSIADARSGLNALSYEGRVLLVRGLASGCQTTAARSDLARFEQQVSEWVDRSLVKTGVGTLLNDKKTNGGDGNHEIDISTLPRFELRLYRNEGDSSRVRAANSCFVVGPSPSEVRAAAKTLQSASDSRLGVELYHSPKV